MTKEEAKSCIYTIKLLRTLALNIHGVIDVVDDKNCEKMIKALEHEHCEDVISRQAVIDTEELIELDDGHSFYHISPEDVKKLPPVIPARKVGKWITVDKEHSKCSTCDVIMLIAMYPNGEANYCPNCGASHTLLVPSNKFISESLL